MSKNCDDLIIVGGGLIGLCLAPILAKLNLRLSLIDQNRISSIKNIQKDTRTVAVSLGTKLLLEKYGIWKSINKFAEPIKNINVFNRNIKSNILFNNKHQKKPMGYIVEHTKFKRELIKIIKSSNRIKLLENKEIVDLNVCENKISIKTLNGNNLSSKVLIAADGKNSYLKSYLKIPQYKYDYKQSALVLNFEHTKNHNNTAYEIFLENGPLATLPMFSPKKRTYNSALIWSEKKSISKALMNIKTDYLKDIIEEQLEEYLGKINKIENIKIFPLSSHICRRFFDKRVVFVGDAAHSIHPIAGQGWNLGMRDVKYLAETFEQCISAGQDLGDKNILKKFSDERFADVSSMLFITHGLNHIFSNRSRIIEKIRTIGFNHINNNNFLSNKLVDYATGITL